MTMLNVSMDFKFDADKVADALEKSIDKGMDALSEEIERNWKSKAESTLKTSKERYLKGLSFERVPDGLEVTVSGWLPVAIEQGVPRFDLKPGFLGNRAARVIPLDGWISPVRFRTLVRGDNRWWHPGIQARAIGEQVKADVPKMISETFGVLISRMSV